MSDKKSLLKEIADKVKRKKALREEIAVRNKNVEAFAIDMINDIEEMIASTVNTSLLASLVPLYIKSFEGRIKAIDVGSTVTVQWFDGVQGIPRVNGILIKWSQDYQIKNNCEEQLFVDVTSLLLN